MFSSFEKVGCLMLLSMEDTFQGICRRLESKRRVWAVFVGCSWNQKYSGLMGPT